MAIIGARRATDGNIADVTRPLSSAPSVSASSLFSHGGFVRLWFARLAGTAGSQMLMIAVGWQMYDLTGSAWDLGLVGLLQFLPALLLVLVAGHVVDRHQRARVLAVCLACQAGIAALLCAAAMQGAMLREWLLLFFPDLARRDWLVTTTPAAPPA